MQKIVGYIGPIILTAMLVLFPFLAVVAGSPHEKAIAAIAVARAMVAVADENPDLPDSKNHFFNTPSPPAATDSEAPDSSPLPTEVSESSRSDISLPMSLTLNAPRFVAATPSHLSASIYTGEDVFGPHWCPNCIRLHRKWGDGNDDLELNWLKKTASGPQIYPAIRFTDGEGRERFPANSSGDYRQPASLEELVGIVERNSVSQLSQSVSGVAGSVRAKSQIRQAIDYFRQYVGEGVTAEMRWDRSGAQSFPLLANGDWSTQALFGKYGHFELSAKGAKNLPITELGIGYRVDGDDITIAPDPVTLKGLALAIGPNPRPNATFEMSSPQPSQFGPMTWLTIASIIRDIWLVLHPTCDLQMGGNISATAVLHGDTITVDFSQGPQIRLVALFTFQLGVKQVVITDSNIHVEFSGSRFVKSRDFSVE